MGKKSKCPYFALGGHGKGKAGLEIFDCRASQRAVYMGKRPNVSDFDDFDSGQDHGGRKFMRYTRAWGPCGAALGLSTGRKGWPGTARTAAMSALKKAAIDRLVHHCVVLELNIGSYRVSAAKKKAAEAVV